MSKEAIDSVLNAPHIATAKIATCKSLSGLCTLEYHIGYQMGTKDRIYWRIWHSDGRGRWNKDWVSVSDIEKLMSKIPANESFKMAALRDLYPSKSNNSHGYLGAAILAEGLLAKSAAVEGQYERCDANLWWETLQGLIEAQTDLLPPSMDQGVGPMVLTIPKVPKSAKKPAAPAANG